MGTKMHVSMPGVSEQAFGSRCADGLYRDFVTHPGATQAKFTLHGDMLLSGGRGSLVKVIRLIFTGVSHVLRYFFVVQRKAFLHVTGQFLSELYYMRKSQDVLKVLQRRNFYVMFITKNHLYQLINEDCHLKFDWNEDFLPTNWKKLALKSCFSTSAIVNLRSNEPAV